MAEAADAVGEKLRFWWIQELCTCQTTSDGPFHRLELHGSSVNFNWIFL